MSILRVDTASLTLTLADLVMPCAIGRGGACPAAVKSEGDGRTPLGAWPLRTALLRPGRVDPAGIGLPWRWIRPGDGWSDDPADAQYNRPVYLPRATSAETLLRDGSAYDVVIVLGHNDSPPVPGRGSAIFLHLDEGRPTAGCIAVARDDMIRLLPLLAPGDRMEII